MGEETVSFTIRHSSPSSSALMVKPSPAASMSGILQVTGRSRVVSYYLLVTSVAKLDTYRELYHWKGFDIKAIPTTRSPWKLCYGSSCSLDHLLPEAMSTMLAKLLPETPSDTPYQVLMLMSIGEMGNIALRISVTTIISLPPIYQIIPNEHFALCSYWKSSVSVPL